jgi:DNA helicase-2/ATP-dependent DNA helicase PcrA
VKFEDLTPRQRQVVESTEGIVVALGGPGTGKTTTALWAGRHALARPGVAAWQRVLFLTFSRTAVGQIARRAPGVLGAGSRIDIATFHGFAWRLIQAFGRYGGHGVRPPRLDSDARTKLLGRDPGRLTYDELIPCALGLLRSRRLVRLVTRRWALVICDEFQDTSDDQWELLTLLSRGGRLLLLGDPNQMIYTFLKDRGVGPERLEEAVRIADRAVEFDARSHRDPTGAIPAMAEAIRRRQFTHEAVLDAIRSGRLTIMPDVPDERLITVVEQQVSAARAAGAVSVGIFGHSNEGVATLGAALARAGMDHVLVGLPEAHAEAIAALATLAEFAVGQATSEDVRVRLATFLTACTRGKSAPELAVNLARGAGLPPRLVQRLNELERGLRKASESTISDVVTVACQAWRALGITGGVRLWQRATLDFVALSRGVSTTTASEESVRAIVAAAARRRTAALVDFDASHGPPVQLMNFHQTKGREADAVILVYRDRDYLANTYDSEPYEEPSRVLFVSLTRGRHTVAVVLPRNPHPLVAPFITSLNAVNNEGVV